MATQAAERPAESPLDTATPEAVVVRFAGDSGDGMQLTGGQFTLSTALAGRSFASAWLGRQSWSGGSNESAPDTEAASSPRSRRDRGFSPIRISGGSAALRTYWTATSRFLPGRQGPLPRDLAAVRRRRVDQANRTNDEIEAIG